MQTMNRRTFLRGAGVAMGLPLLDAMIPPAWARAKPPVARRMIAISPNLGILPQFFFPEKAGRDYALSPYLEILKDFRQEMTVFSGVSHPQCDGGHQADTAFLTAATHPGAGGFRSTVSLDQVMAEHVGDATRLPTLNLGVGHENSRSLSWTRSGVMIPVEKNPTKVYQRLFVQGTAKEIERRMEELRVGRSLLDSVSDRAKSLGRDLGPADRERMDQYLSSVRELEQRLQAAETWEQKPKPKVSMPAPQDPADTNDFETHQKLIYGLAKLAIETDSTRIVTIMSNSVSVTASIKGVSHETHTLTHHGNRPETLAELRLVEECQFRGLAELLEGLRSCKEEGGTLLDRTMVLYGSTLGSANAHSNVNLPVLLAGGGFKHGQHLAFDKQKNYPLPNLFVSMLQRLGIETDKFASSTGTMRDLSMA
jgi:uncharacterized protein DUF1552